MVYVYKPIFTFTLIECLLIIAYVYITFRKRIDKSCTFTSIQRHAYC